MTDRTEDAYELGRCAEITCHLAHAPAQAHAELVTRFGLTWPEWEAIAARWAAAREAELAAGGTQLSTRFVRVFIATAERLNAQPANADGAAVSGMSPAPTVAVGRTPSGAEEIDAPRLASPTGLAETSDVDLRAIIARVTAGSLPFGGKSTLDHTERRPPPKPVATGTVGADYRAAVAAADNAGPLPFGQAGAPGRPALPPQPASNAEASEPDEGLALDHYAAITAALARGEPREGVLASYRLTARQFDQRAQAWGARFQREPDLLTRFMVLVRRG